MTEEIIDDMVETKQKTTENIKNKTIKYKIK